jgi:Rrf2 family iron-sulfur cluster assembly transcriptional regulator
MNFLSRRTMLALAAVVDIAVYARPLPVAAKVLAVRLELPPRHLEPLLQALVRANILKGLRGPRGGYELARERRRISVAEILRAISSEQGDDEGKGSDECRLVADVIGPMLENAGRAFLAELEHITIDDLCRRAEALGLFADAICGPDFTI